MNNELSHTRWDEITALWKSYPPLYGIAGFFVGLLAFPAMSLLVDDFERFLTDLVPEAFGIAFTVLLIDRLYAARDSTRQVRETKDRLLRQISGQSNELAKSAIDELRHYGWITGANSLLPQRSFVRANLAGANLWKANMTDCDLTSINLDEANLWNATLTNSVLIGASMRQSNLSSASLMDVDLTGANLAGADLSDADLTGAMLSGVNLVGTKFSTYTKLPDGKNWSTRIDMKRFGIDATTDLTE